jgi:UDP-2-acetamido-3-amino-2,3-dideoxy-glucuronate N-acetyltransferase
VGHFVHPQGICESNRVGNGTKVWAFAHVLPGAIIGQDCNICDHVFIENDVVLGDRVTVKSGVQLWDGLRVGSDVFIGPNATFTNDFFPKSRQRPSRFARTTLEEGCSIGANATILPGISIGRNAMVGAGAVVTRSVPPNAIVHGNPARIRGSSSQIDKAGRVEVPAKDEDLPTDASHARRPPG